MKLGIISDSHDVLSNIRKAVTIFNERAVDMVVHAGDFTSPFTALEFKNLKCKMIAVFGNNDGDKILLLSRFKDIAEIFDYCHKFEFDNKKMIVTHYPDMADSLGKSGDYDLVIYGHTHKYRVVEGVNAIINPGTSSGYLTEKPTIAIVDTNLWKFEIIEL